MKIYDISQEVFSCEVYSGDPSPKRELLSSIGSGDLYSLTSFSMCAHNGTHIDAPSHFIGGGKTVEQLDISCFVGYAFVAEFDGKLTAGEAMEIVKKARVCHSDACERILIKGSFDISCEAAKVFIDEGIKLFGTESQTVGPYDAPMELHKLFLGAEVVLLEGIRLSEVREGAYFLSAAPLLLGGADGAPCRAVLIEF